jgi:hypothetical protein
VKRALIVMVMVAALPAHAYVYTKSISGTPVKWPTRCIVLQPDARGDANDAEMDGDTIAATLDRATGNWNARLQTCTYMALGTVPGTKALEAVSDGRPAVVFRSDVWGRNGMAYDSSSIGVTTVWFADRPNDYADGRITDADIELNAVNYTFTSHPDTAVARSGTMVADLENTLTHELGHVLGLAHTCWDHKHPPDQPDVQPTDNTGALVPDCKSASLPSNITSATMFPYAPDRSVAMRVVGNDDLQGVCDNYQMTASPPACYAFIEVNGCAMDRVAHRPQTLVAWLLLCAALAVYQGRRRGVR